MPKRVRGRRQVDRRPSLAVTLAELRQRRQPSGDDDLAFPTLPQQRADAFTVLFLQHRIEVATEVVIPPAANTGS